MQWAEVGDGGSSDQVVVWAGDWAAGNVVFEGGGNQAVVWAGDWAVQLAGNVVFEGGGGGDHAGNRWVGGIQGVYMHVG